ncbi:MAG: hypothetical protein D3919_13020 [Candidatus Electrothrix sp. AW5]|nr:hypothetical protein [Candidatus Electrothrix gigas]
MNIVIDKSFLDGASPNRVRRLCEENTVLFSESLFFELITTTEESKKRCFAKLPEGINPLKLIPNVGKLLRYEIENQRRCIPLLKHVFDKDFQFNERLRQGTYVLQGHMLESLTEWKDQVKSDTEDFLVRCSIVHQFFPELNGIEYKHFATAIENARVRVAEDQDFVKEIYASFLNENAPKNAPAPELVGPDWAFFRWTQCQLLSALRMFGKYQGKIDFPVSKGVFTRAEHTMHDINYTILAALSGSLATGDQEIIDDFCLVCPEGVLITKG